jgi:hypothetical protein
MARCCCGRCRSERVAHPRAFGPPCSERVVVVCKASEGGDGPARRQGYGRPTRTPLVLYESAQHAECRTLARRVVGRTRTGATAGASRPSAREARQLVEVSSACARSSGVTAGEDRAVPRHPPAGVSSSPGQSRAALPFHVSTPPTAMSSSVQHVLECSASSIG